MICEKTNPPLDEDITSVHEDEYLDGEVSLSYESDDEQDDNWLASSQELTTSDEDTELNSILCTTLEKVNKFLSEQVDQNKTSFLASLDALLSNMSPENRSRAEDKILFYLVKCKLNDMNGEGINDLKI